MTALEPAGPDLLERLAAALGPDALRPPEPRYLEEPRGRYHGHAAAVLRPTSTEAVAAARAMKASRREGRPFSRRLLRHRCSPPLHRRGNLRPPAMAGKGRRSGSDSS